MKIAQVSPLYESVPPKLYGGTERVVSNLPEELVRMGHQVTLFASGDSITAAELVPVTSAALRLDTNCRDTFVHHVLQQQEVLDRLPDFDVIHYHTDYFHFPMSAHHRTPTVTTLHGRLDLPELLPLYARFPRMPLVSISDSQRAPLAGVAPNWVRTIYHGLPVDRFHLQDNPKGYLAFLGRISPEKRVDRAIEIAKQLGMPLRIAAKIDKVDREYFEAKIRHLMEDPLVEYIGEIGESEKQDFLGGAACLLFPIDWPEPFGLVMIEAMACGTPVVAYGKGSVPEIIRDGVNGFIVGNLREAVDAVERAQALSRARVRAEFESRFNVTLMATRYLEVYQALIAHSEALFTPSFAEKADFHASPLIH